MQPSQVVEMIWAGLISRDQERKPHEPDIIKMRMAGTVGEPEILLDVLDPVTGLPAPWSISEKGLIKRDHLIQDVIPAVHS